MIAVFSILRPNTFFSKGNFETIFGTQSVLVVLTLALVITLTVGEFDLSVASTLGLAATLIATLNVTHGWSVGWAVLVALIAGAAVGTVNGFLVIRIGVDAIVATLGMATLLLGVALWVSESVIIGGISDNLRSPITHRLFGLPASFYYALILTAILWYILRHTPLGRHLLFVGQGRDVARLAGIRVERVRWGAFIVSGLVSALAGVIAAGTFGAFLATVSPSYLLPAFAAAFLGTAAVNPGRFNPWGSVIAIYFLITGITGLQLMGLSGWIEQVFYGGSLIAAVTISTMVRKKVVGST
ncbi:MAG: ABC transporter permease [Dehalococcoidia bacterium]